MSKYIWTTDTLNLKLQELKALEKRAHDVRIFNEISRDIYFLENIIHEDYELGTSADMPPLLEYFEDGICDLQNMEYLWDSFLGFFLGSENVCFEIPNLKFRSFK